MRSHTDGSRLQVKHDFLFKAVMATDTAMQSTEQQRHEVYVMSDTKGVRDFKLLSLVLTIARMIRLAVYLLFPTYRTTDIVYEVKKTIR
jgi:hypothetical protein